MLCHFISPLFLIVYSEIVFICQLYIIILSQFCEFVKIYYLKNTISSVPTTIRQIPAKAFFESFSLKTKYANSLKKEITRLICWSTIPKHCLRCSNEENWTLQSLKACSIKKSKPLLLRVGHLLERRSPNATRGLCGPNTAVLKPTVTLSHHVHRLFQILGGNLMMQSPYDIHRPAALMACKQLILSNFPHALRRMPEDACRQGRSQEPWFLLRYVRSYGTPRW